MSKAVAVQLGSTEEPHDCHDLSCLQHFTQHYNE